MQSPMLVAGVFERRSARRQFRKRRRRYRLAAALLVAVGGLFVGATAVLAFLALT